MTVPVLAADLAQEIADLRSMLACAEAWADDLFEGRRLPGEWDPDFSFYGGKDFAVAEADAVAADLRRQLAALEAVRPG